MSQTVIGFFEEASDAQHAIQRLESMGIPRQDIDFSNRGSDVSATSTNRDKDSGNRNNNNNGISGFFNSIFGNDSDEAKRYSSVGDSGYSIVTVHAQNREEAERAADLLDECGAIDIDEKASAVGSTDKRASDIRSEKQPIAGGRDESQSINRIQENLEVGKRTVEQGGVRVRSRIIERPIEERVRLREERVHVERQPVDRPVSATELNNFQEGDIELIERAEVPVVNKQARVVEEIRVSKDITEREQVVRDTVRNTEVDVENINREDRNTNNLNDTRTTF